MAMIIGFDWLQDVAKCQVSTLSSVSEGFYFKGGADFTMRKYLFEVPLKHSETFIFAFHAERTANAIIWGR